MDTTSKNTENTSGGTNGDIPRKFNISGGEDLPDTPRNSARMEPDTPIRDLPDEKNDNESDNS